MWRRVHRLIAATSRSRPPSLNSPPSELQTTCWPGFRFQWLYHFPAFSRSVYLAYLGSGRPISQIKVPQNYKKNTKDNFVNRRNDWQQTDQPRLLLRRNKTFPLRSKLLQHQAHHPNGRGMPPSLIRRALFPIMLACTEASRNGNITWSIHCKCRLLFPCITLFLI